MTQVIVKQQKKKAITDTPSMALSLLELSKLLLAAGGVCIQLSDSILGD